MKSTTRKTGFLDRTKRAVLKRDGGMCIICGKPGAPNAHFIPRSQIGKGIEENTVTLCYVCHQKYDNSEHRPRLKRMIRTYLDKFYPHFTDKERTVQRFETWKK